jgi:hypothetical protein
MDEDVENDLRDVKVKTWRQKTDCRQELTSAVKVARVLRGR